MAFPKTLLGAMRDGALGQGPFIPVRPYLSLGDTGARVGAGAGTAMAGSSSEAGLSLTFSWGMEAGNRPDTLKLMSADRRSRLIFQGPASLPRAARAGTTSPFPGKWTTIRFASHSHGSLTTPGSRRDHPHFTDEKPRFRVEKRLPPGLVGSARGHRDRSWSGGHRGARAHRQGLHLQGRGCLRFVSELPPRPPPGWTTLRLHPAGPGPWDKRG